MKAHLDERQMTLDFSLLANFFGNLGVHTEVVDAIRGLRAQGYLTGLVTNNVKEFGDSWRTLVPLDELFDVVVDSSVVGMRKPNPAIYLHALDLLGQVPPARALFLDDAPGNVAGAEAAGLHAILVDDPGTALAELRALLG
jgi:putative hydrolase of the HAD superfamily